MLANVWRKGSTCNRKVARSKESGHYCTKPLPVTNKLTTKQQRGLLSTPAHASHSPSTSNMLRWTAAASSKLRENLTAIDPTLLRQLKQYACTQAESSARLPLLHCTELHVTKARAALLAEHTDPTTWGSYGDSYTHKGQTHHHQ